MTLRFLTTLLLPALCFCLPQVSVAQSVKSDGQLRITNGPVIEQVTDTTATIAWSTNVNAGTQLHYGVDAEKLDQATGMPWGGLTHRVELKDLRPGTQYYFRAESPHGQGSGVDARAPILSFRTRDGQ
jgi:hypothetical protein